jgi:hypothetical protein
MRLVAISPHSSSTRGRSLGGSDNETCQMWPPVGSFPYESLGIERCPEVVNLFGAEGAPFFCPQGQTTGNDPLVTVLVGLAGPEQIAHEAPA